ncbi:MAG: hypothetical protein WD766_03325 [Gemmatimonadota bacterium]
MKSLSRSTATMMVVLVVGCGEAPAPEEAAVMPDTQAAESAGLQELIELPEGFGSEGIAIGADNTFYAASMSPPALGQIVAGDLATGEYSELVPAGDAPALGLKHAETGNLLFVAGGDSGGGRVYDAESGAEVASYDFGGSMINDVELTPDAAYFTDSQAAALYRVAIGPDGQPGDFTTIDLPANFAEGGQCGAPPIGGNGAAASADGRYVLLIHMSEGQLYRLDTQTEEVQQVQLTGGDACSADGLLLDGNTLYGVQNFANQIVVVEMGDDLLTGTVTRHITEPFASNPATKVPTTIADAGDALYAVTAGFAEPSPDYVVRVDK